MEVMTQCNESIYDWCQAQIWELAVRKSFLEKIKSNLSFKEEEIASSGKNQKGILGKRTDVENNQLFRQSRPLQQR